MVACTTEYDLPYQEGADAPCDLVPIWCQFADIIETQLVALDNIVNRTAVGVPFAKVTKTSTTTYPVPAQPGIDQFAIAFDSVVMDNDNMVNLPADPLHVYVQRPGIYQVDAVVVASASIVGSMIEATIFPRLGFLNPYSHDVDVYWRQDSAYVHEFLIINVPATAFTAPTPPSFGLQFGTGAGPTPNLVVTAADMTVTWVADEA